MYNQILLPTDGSKGTERAVDQALTIAETYDATLHILRVIQTADLPSDISEETVGRAFEERGRKEIADVEKRACQAGIGSIEKSVASGIPHRTVLEYAKKHDIDLIVMGTHGRKRLEHFLLGSVTERVVRLSDIPVLTVRMTNEYEETGYSIIMVPTDGSNDAKAATDHAIDLAATYGAAVHAVYVIDPRLLTNDSMSDPIGGLPMDSVLNAAKIRGKSATENVAQKAKAAKVDCEEHVFEGYPYQEIRRFVTEQDVDLVVMGTHGRTGLEHFLLGSVTEKVIRSVDVPVLTVRMSKYTPN